MSHHYSGPDFGFPRGDARLDFTDPYAFPKPGDPRKSILIMNVHPSAVVNPPGPTTAEPFAPEALYELKIDTDGDAVADIAYRVRFSSSESGACCRHKLSSLSVRTEMPTSRVSRQTMPVSSPFLRMRWSTPVAMRRRKQGGWREHCCPTYCPTTRRVPRFFRAMAVRSPTMPPTPSWQSSQTGR